MNKHIFTFVLFMSLILNFNAYAPLDLYRTRVLRVCPGANLTGIDKNILLTNNLKGVNIQFAHLEKSDLSGFIFTKANLQSANLSNTNLTKANFEDANLSNAILTGATLKNAIFTRANLTGANLKEASYDEAVFLDTTMPNGKKYSGPGKEYNAK